MTSSLKQALNNLMYNISERFDYRIMTAPILNYQGNISYVAENPDGISGINLISKEDAVTRLGALPSSGGSVEPGLSSTLAVLQSGINSGFLRKNGHTIVVLMSNGDDYDAANCVRGSSCNNPYIESKAGAIKSFLASSMTSESYHFYTLVPHQPSCDAVGNGAYSSSGYRYASQLVSGSSTDSIDICSTAFNHVFDKVNNDITATVVKHKYNYWPIIETAKTTTNPPFDPSRLRVTKMISGDAIELTEGSDWEYVGHQYNLPTRFAPTVGEATTGYFIKLTGNGIVTYPQCLRIDTQDLATCYGYIPMQNKPSESSIVLKINGQTIPQSSSNGWQYMGYRSSQNIRIKCPGSSYDSGVELKSGHFLKLTGDAIYGNSAVVDLSYDPASL